MTKLDLKGLAESQGVTRRTVRYYISEGLLPPAVGVGKHASYTEEHSNLLWQIMHLQGQGKTLAEIRSILYPVTEIPTLVQEVLNGCWDLTRVSPDVIVLVRDNTQPQFSTLVGKNTQ